MISPMKLLNVSPPDLMFTKYETDLLCQNMSPANIFGTLKVLNPYFWSQKTWTLSLTRDPPESQFLIVNTDSVD